MNFVKEMVKHGDDAMSFVVNSFVFEKPNGFYVYALINPLSNKIFYIGKGKDNRCFHHQKETTVSTINRDKFNIIQSIKEAGCLPEIKFFKDALDENSALLLEKNLIKHFRDELTNIVNGRSGICVGLLNGTLKIIELVKRNRIVRGQETIMPNACKILDIWVSKPVIYIGDAELEHVLLEDYV